MNAYSGRSAPRPASQFNRLQGHTDVSTQADLISYESEDERMGRRDRSKRGTPYSKVDIREQYCINNKEVQVLESGSSALFGCLSKHNESSCKAKNSLLSVCMGRVPSDENLHDLRLQPLPRKPIDDLERAYLRRRPKSLYGGDAVRYPGISENEIISNADCMDSDYECGDMRRGHAISFSSEDLATSCPAHYLPPPPPPPAGAARTKHVSFARSHTLTSFDDAIIELRKAPQLYKSQERLILSTQPQKRSFHPSCDQKIMRKTPMKTQATQTGCLGREPPNYLSLSPRTIRRVKMVSQGAQTNGVTWNGRRLMKSYSEAGCHYGEAGAYFAERNREHDALTRTQSEEPRSPYGNRSSTIWPASDISVLTGVGVKPDDKKCSKSSRIYKEIFIDFEPVELEKNSRQSFNDGEFTSEPTANPNGNDQIVDRVDGIKVSLASFSTVSDDEVLEVAKDESRSHSIPRNQDSVDEEFHENLVYGGIFKKLSASEQSLKPACQKEDLEKKSGASTPDMKEILPMATLNVSLRASPFASNDSLTNDQKDHSDGMWNESQSTVLLQAESENNEMNIRTPSKKQLLLLQHQQRSSVDTEEILESDVLHLQMKNDRSPVYSPSNQESAVPLVTVAAVHQNETLSFVAGSELVQSNRKTASRNLGPNAFFGLRDVRRKTIKSPEKDEARLDSGKATDISETSTTEDYATAHDNSGTDTSSKRSVGHRIPESKPGSKEGSSFESASSIHSFAREDAAQIVPSSPPTIREEKAEEIACNDDVLNESHEGEVPEPSKEQRQTDDKDELSGDAESSSSGSYSLDSGQREQKSEWSDQDKAKSKKEFKFDLDPLEKWSDLREEENNNEVPALVPHRVIKNESFTSIKRLQPSPPISWKGSKNDEIALKMVRSPAMAEGFLKPGPFLCEEILPSLNPETEISSDESSCGCKTGGAEEPANDHSPRRHRRRGGGRGRRNQNAAEYSGRKKPLAQLTLATPQQQQPQHQLNLSGNKYLKSPAHSPRNSPKKSAKTTVTVQDHKKTNVSRQKDGAPQLKTLSAESLRSVSPGSDSVFYNEIDPHLLCHQCGKEFENENIQLKMEESIEEIVQPPAGFADSPENTRNKSHRLYKKQEKRFRSEERSGEKRRHTRHRVEGLRAKSEERGKEKMSKPKLRPHARSTDASMERLRGADSSPSISEPLTTEEPKIYADSYKKSSWICIRDVETISKWNRSQEGDDERLDEDGGKDEADSTSSEKEFKRKYQAATHRMVHRKSSMDMYRRLQSKTFGFEFGGCRTLRERLEDLMQMLLVVWSTQEKAFRVINDECDRKIIVKRKSGEFGFRIHGSRPVVVSAIEPDTPAESSGLEVGDIVLSVNGVSVLEASHSDVVKLAHAGSDVLELEVARTSSALTATPREEEHQILHSGFLNKRGANGRWHRRWFALKTDHCLYCYKYQTETQPIGALLLYDYAFAFTPDSGKANSFLLQKDGARTVELFADTKDQASDWKKHLEKATESREDAERRWFEDSCRLLHRPASSVPEPDCFGHLTQLEDKWRRRYCVLKDAALLLYSDSAASTALAVACLQGYRVQSSGVSGKRFSFEVVPPEPKQKHFYFYTDTEIDKKRWIAAIEYSIDRWMRVG